MTDQAATAVKLTEPEYSMDAVALEALSPDQRVKFEQWMIEMAAAHQAAGSPYGEGSLWRLTGVSSWIPFFLDGDTAADALAEDLSCGD